jgi:ubiquinone/menaquinone biosynthesis C-methylase UbiE
VQSKRGSKLKTLKPIMGKYSLSLSDTILDAGCGYGLRSIEMSREVGCRIVSIDLSLGCINSVYAQRGEYDIDFIRADLQNLPLVDNSFDKVVSGDVLEHVPNISKTLAEFYRVSRRKGFVFLLVPSYVSERLFLKLDNTYAERIGHLRTFRSTQLLSLVESAGFCTLDNYKVEFFRAFYHLFQVLSGSKIEHQTGRAIIDNSGLSIASRIFRIIFYSWVGDVIETVGKYIFPNSFVVIAVKI